MPETKSWVHAKSRDSCHGYPGDDPILREVENCVAYQSHAQSEEQSLYQEKQMSVESAEPQKKWCANRAFGEPELGIERAQLSHLEIRTRVWK